MCSSTLWTLVGWPSTSCNWVSCLNFIPKTLGCNISQTKIFYKWVKYAMSDLWIYLFQCAINSSGDNPISMPTSSLTLAWQMQWTRPSSTKLYFSSPILEVVTGPTPNVCTKRAIDTVIWESNRVMNRNWWRLTHTLLTIVNLKNQFIQKAYSFFPVLPPYPKEVLIAEYDCRVWLLLLINYEIHIFDTFKAVLGWHEDGWSNFCI